MPVSPQAEAIVQLARKRRILDRAGCARLRILLAERKVESAAQARAFLDKAKLLPLGPAQQLVAHLPPEEGMLLGSYRVLAHLADGGMGSVWLATRDDSIPAPAAQPDQHRTPMPATQPQRTPLPATPLPSGTPTPMPGHLPPQAGELVVVKTMKGQFAGVEEVRRRFERECRYMASIVHPSVVAICDHGAAEDGTLFMVLKFVESGDLKELVEQQGALPEALALSFVYQVADALDAAHARKLIHRDIKPANIFASPEGTCQLADFGIARSTSVERTQLTMEGTLVGSPAYMSPEQVLAESDLDIRSDLYALGCVLYFCLSGHEPFRGRLQEVLHQHRTAPIPDPREGRPELTAGTAAIIRRLMAKKREERFQVPADLRQAIGEVLAALGTGAAAGAAPMPMPAHSEDRTITADLLAEGAGAPIPPHSDGHDSSTDSHPTVMVGSNGMPAPDATMAVAAGEWASGTAAQIVTGATPKPAAATPKPAGDRLEGDHGSAMDQPWIALTGDGCHVLLYARRQATMGKLCEPPSDICLRKYPTTRWRDDCLRISRQHLQLRFDPASSRLLLTDLGSGNGTQLDGHAMSPNTPVEIEPGAERRVIVASALALTVRARPRQGQAVAELAGAGRSDGTAACGIDCGHACDVAVVGRSDNRPGMAYALVLRRATLGGSGADIVLPDAAGPAAELALFRGRWLWRPAGTPAWKPLSDGAEVAAGGKRLKARVGGYDIFQSEG